MRDELEPTVGKWYLNIGLDEPFRVVAIDEEREIVEIRYLDGEADEIELDAWSDLDIEAAEAPEEEESEDEEEPKHGSGWREPDAGGADDWEEDEEDDDEEEEDEDEDDDRYGSE